MTTSIYILFAISVALAIGGLVWAFLLGQRLDKLTQGTDDNKLEDIVDKAFNQAKNIENKHNNLEGRISAIEAFSKHTSASHAFLIFDAYGNTTGSQSNTVCVLNTSGSGYIITNLYTREQTRVFMRPISNFLCTLELLPEEQEVLTNATNTAKKRAF